MIRLKRKIEDPRDLEFLYYIYILRMNNKFLDPLVFCTAWIFLFFYFISVDK